MLRILFLIASLGCIAFALSCNSGPAAQGSSNDSPTEAYKRLFAAVKSKNTDAIKAEMTTKTQEFAQMVSQKNNTPIEKVFENGFTATTFSAALPQIRDQRVSDNMGAVEVWNSKESKWEDLPFVNENGAWKIAVGDLFAGTFKSPGPGRDVLEKQAANAAGNGPVQIPAPNTASNMGPQPGPQPAPAANMAPIPSNKPAANLGKK